MPETKASLPILISNTGPLISIFQSESLELVTTLFGVIHTTATCIAELRRHDWGEAMAQAGPRIISHQLTDDEAALARKLAERIAAHPASKNPDPDHHLGKAEAMVLAQRPEFIGAVLLLDERAARAVAKEIGLTISGFAGVLLLAVEEGLLTAEELHERLESCRRQGTHYSKAFIEQIYLKAKGEES
jgi:predicted nucleic acid-binding protein